VLIWPARAADQLRAAVAAAVQTSALLVQHALTGVAGTPPPITEPVVLEMQVEQGIKSAQDLIAATRQEFVHPSHARDVLPLLVSHAQRIFEHAASVAEIARGLESEDAVQPLLPCLAAAASATGTAGAALAAAIIAREPGPALRQAEQAVAGLMRAAGDLARVEIRSVAHGEELLRLHSLVLALQAFAQENERTLQRIAHPDGAPSPEECARMAATAAQPPLTGLRRIFSRHRPPA